MTESGDFTHLKPGFSQSELHMFSFILPENFLNPLLYARLVQRFSSWREGGGGGGEPGEFYV